MLDEIFARVANDTQLMADFHALCDCDGRFAGTEGEARAREYLAAQLPAIGPAHRETVAYLGWTRGPARISGHDAAALVRSPATPGLMAKLVDLGRGAPEDFSRAGDRVRGAIVLVRHEFMVGTGHLHRRKKYDAARAAGAAGFVIACHVPGAGPVTGSSGDGTPGHVPCAGVSYETGQALAARDGQAVTLEVGGSFAERTAENLFATLPGAGPELVVLSAHYDGHNLSESAIDNASGVACALAAARAFRGVALPRGIELALFTIEEWALMGSRLHLAALSEAERARRVFNVNLDSVAGAEGLTVLTSGAPGMDAFIASTTPEVGTYGNFMGNSDHANYLRAGIPAFRLCAGFDQPESAMRLLLTPQDNRGLVTEAQLRRAAATAARLVYAACTSATLPARLSPQDAARIIGG
jgi:aminopeptidase YwaD